MSRCVHDEPAANDESKGQKFTVFVSLGRQAARDLELILSHHASLSGDVPGSGSNAAAAYLFVSKAQLVLEDRLAISQQLHLVGQSVEGVGEGEREVEMVHAHGLRGG